MQTGSGVELWDWLTAAEKGTGGRGEMGAEMKERGA